MKTMTHTRKQPPLPIIDDQEKQRRFEAARDAEASLRIEGLFLSDEAKALMNRWVNCEITDEEYHKIVGIS